MPLHLTRWVLDRMSQRWFAGADSHANQRHDLHRFRQHSPAPHDGAVLSRLGRRASGACRSSGGRRTGAAMLRAMAGIGHARSAWQQREPATRYRQAEACGGTRSQVVDSPERLTLFLAEAFGVPVQLKEFIATWIDIPRKLQSQLGRAAAALGRGATIGPRVFSRQGRVELAHRADGLDDLPFLPRRRQPLAGVEARRARRHRRAVRRRPAAGAGGGRSARAEDRRRCNSGAPHGLRALAERGDADEMRMRTIVGWRPELKGAAA